MKDMFFKEAAFPLKIILAFLSLVLTISSFLGFPNDPLLCGIFWAVVCLLSVLGVIEYVIQKRQS